MKSPLPSSRPCTVMPLTLSPYILLAFTASWLSLSLYMLAARLLYFCWASVVWQLWDLKNELALALPASQNSQNISTSSSCPTPPPSCICLSCCHVQFVSRLVDLMKVRWTPRDLQSHSESHMSRVELSLSLTCESRCSRYRWRCRRW